VVCGLEADVFMAILVRGVAGKYSGDVEYDRSFLESEGVLRRRFVRESVKPISTCCQSTRLSSLWRHGAVARSFLNIRTK
jgi:hypothetical protein